MRPSLFVVAALGCLGVWVGDLAPAVAQRRGIQMRPGDHQAGREFRRGFTTQQRHSALDAPVRRQQLRGGRTLSRTTRTIGRPRNARGAAERSELQNQLVFGEAAAPPTPGSAAPVFAFGTTGPASRTARRPTTATAPTKRTARPIKRVRMKPSLNHQMIDETNALVRIYGRTEEGGPDVAVVAFEYNNQTGAANVRMTPPEIAVNGDEIRRQFSDNGKVIDQDEYVLDAVPEVAKFYNGRKRTQITLTYGGGNDGADPRVDEVMAMAGELRAKDPQLSFEDAALQAYTTLNPGIMRSFKKHGYDPGKLRLTFMPEGPDGHAELRVTTGEKPRPHNAITLMIQTFSVVLTGEFRKPGILKRAGKPNAKNLVIGIDGTSGIDSKYTKTAKKLTETGRLITLTAQAKGKRKSIDVAAIVVDVASIDIGPLNNIVVDDLSGQPTALIVDGMPYEQVALREGLAAYKGKTKPIIRQVFSGALPELITERAEELYNSSKEFKRDANGYQRALAQAVMENVPIAKDLATIGYDVTNLEVRPRGDGYMLLQFSP